MKLLLTRKSKQSTTKLRKIKLDTVYNEYRQLLQISTLSWGNVCKCELSTSGYVLTVKRLLEEPSTIKRFGFS